MGGIMMGGGLDIAKYVMDLEMLINRLIKKKEKNSKNIWLTKTNSNWIITYKKNYKISYYHNYILIGEVLNQPKII